MRDTESREYRSWDCMVRRCRYDAKYAGQGVRVCERWETSFEAFLADMGPAPSEKHSIERIKNDRGYEPGNCKWADRIEQSANRTNNHKITAFGRTQVVKHWERETGIPRYAIKNRIKCGWTPENALTIPYKQKAGRRGTGPTVVVTSLSAPTELLGWLRQTAAAHGCSVSKYLCSLAAKEREAMSQNLKAA